MYSYVVLIINNIELNNLRISNLINIYSISIILLCLNALKNKSFYIYILVINIYLIPVFQLALTNTLFLIHPILLYFSWLTLMSFSYYKLFKKYYLNLIAIILGGLWAMQELNWGGWWNWDAVEMGSSLVIISILYNLHTSQIQNSAKSYILHIQYILLIGFIFFLNKIGLGGSIHAFTLTQTIKFYYIEVIYIYLLIFFLLKLLNIKIIFKKIILMCLYSIFLNVNFLKFICLGIICIQFKQKISLMYLWHICFGLLIYIGFFINSRLYSNTHIFENLNKNTYFIISSYLFQVQTNWIYLWQDQFLFKPQVYFFINLMINLYKTYLNFI